MSITPRAPKNPLTAAAPYVPGNGYQPASSAAPAAVDTMGAFDAAMPGFKGRTGKASSIIDDLLNGTPSLSTTRNAQAAFGAGSGTGAGSDFSKRWGYDLYNQMGERRQQQGIQNLLQMLQGYAGTIVPTAAQSQQNQQYYAGLGENSRQFGFSQGQQDRQFGANINQNENQFTRNLDQQGNQFNAQMGARANEFNQNYALQKFQAMLNGLQLGKQFGTNPLPNIGY